MSLLGVFLDSGVRRNDGQIRTASTLGPTLLICCGREITMQRCSKYNLSTKAALLALQIALMAFLGGCSGKGAAFLPYYILSGGEGRNPCTEMHPVHAYLSGCRLSEFSMQLSQLITPQNANDRAAGVCLLELATTFQNIEILRKLIENGAKPSLCTTGFSQRVFVHTINSCPFRGGDCEVLFLTLEGIGVHPSNIQDILTQSAARGCASATRFSLKRGADPNRLDESGKRPLHYASNATAEGNIETVKILRQFGADPHLSSAVFESPLELARRRFSGAIRWPAMEAAFGAVTETQ
ncbi:MAG: hypothetical protein KF834_09205 [Burkholderiales bacterium]|nr:hypothetical protein [Burkholderiales bacterium]